jgi:CRISPR-associated endonuclease/helicase Cas3
LIEAGVNISFECVIRDLAGLDSIFQAAGRCNRHGELCGARDVFVVDVAEENLSRLPDIKIGAEITRRLFNDGNLDINEYYRQYFYARTKVMDYLLEGGATVYDLLSVNRCGWNVYKSRMDKRGVIPPELRCAIRSAAEEFYVIDKGSTDIIVPYGEGMELLSKYSATLDLADKRKLLRKLGKYSVSVYEWQYKALKERGALDFTSYKGLTVLAAGFYHDARGVDIEGHHAFLNG